MMNDRDELVRLYRAENKALVEKDLVTLDHILADWMTLTHVSGYVQPKMEWIDQIQNGQIKYYAFNEDNISDLKIKGNWASLIGRRHVKASLWGSGISTWPLQMRMYFKKENGKWIIDRQVASPY